MKRTKESLIEEYMQQSRQLLEHYPQGWWSADYCYWGDLLVMHIFRSWKLAGHTDQEFEDVFGGDPETEIIFDIFRPTAHLSTADYHCDPSPTAKLDRDRDEFVNKL